MGIVSPIGIGWEAFWDALLAGHCGIGPVTQTNLSGMPPQLAGEVRNFDAKKFVANRKGLKVMSRDAQLGIAASMLACHDAGIVTGKIDPERFGVVLGADPICSPIQESEATYGACVADGRFDFRLWGTKGMTASFPLGFLRVLPNMVASHVSIAQDARGPNNTIHEGEISSLLAVIESASVIQRGMADVMLAGGASSQCILWISCGGSPWETSRRGTKIRRPWYGPSTPAATAMSGAKGPPCSFWKAARMPSRGERRSWPG